MSKPTTDPSERFLKACLGEPVDRPPVWLMRQAGRYMAEYRAVREQAGSFLNLCHNPELCLEVTLQPIKRFGFDAAILFSDILIPAQAMGAEVEFVTGEGPKIRNPFRCEEDLARFAVPEPEEKAPFVFEAVRLLAAELEIPLIHFTGAPWTLFCYMVEGGGSKHFLEAKRLAQGNPALAMQLIDKIVEYSIKHAVEGIKAGARAFQLFDTWAELHDPQDFRTYCLEPSNRILRGIRAAVGPEVPLIYFSKGSAAQLDALAEIEADVISIDWRLDLELARTALPGHVLQGNLDPLVLVAGPEATRTRTQRVLAEGGGSRHVFNLGHGILPQTPLESVDALVETVRAFG